MGSQIQVNRITELLIFLDFYNGNIISYSNTVRVYDLECNARQHCQNSKINILKVPNMHRFNIVLYLLLVISNTVISNEDQPKHI